MVNLGTEVGFEPTIIVLETIALDRTKLHGIKLERIVRFELTPYGLEGRRTTFVLYPHCCIYTTFSTLGQRRRKELPYHQSFLAKYHPNVQEPCIEQACCSLDTDPYFSFQLYHTIYHNSTGNPEIPVHQNIHHHYYTTLLDLQ